MSRTSLGSKSTGSDGKASWSYTGTGDGLVGFVAVYDEKESNIVRIDDYTPSVTDITLSASASSIVYGQSVTLTASVVDQHGQALDSGTVTFKANGTSIGTGTISSGVATLTASDLDSGSYSITAEINSITSNTVNVNVLGLALQLKTTVTSSFSSYNNSPFTYSSPVLVQWGTNIWEEYTGGQLAHTYPGGANNTIKIYGDITELNNYAFRESHLEEVTLSGSIVKLSSGSFRDCTGLTSVTIPDSVTYIGASCFKGCTGLTSVAIPNSVTNIGAGFFYNCTGLTELVLNWETSSDIVTYDSTWIYGCTSFDHFLIPTGTKALYEAKSYPSNLLKEDGAEPDSIDFTLTAGKQILSYADVSGGNEYATLTATVYDEDDNPLENVDVNLYNGSTLWDTLTTGSDGTVSKTYTSQGSGDIVFTAEVDGTLLTKTFAIEDLCLYVSGSSNAHFPTATSSSGWLSGGAEKIPVDSPITLPSAFEISFKGYITNTNGWTLVAVGENDSCNNYAGGQFINRGAFLRKGWAGSCGGAYPIQQSNCFNLNEETTVIYQYDSGTHKLKIGNNEYTATDTTYTPTYFLGIGNSASGSKLKEIKIKPL